MTYTVRTLRGSSYVGHEPPDGGWGWVVAFAAFCIDGLAYSASRGMGVFYDDIKRDLGLNNSQTSLVVSVLSAVFGFSGEFPYFRRVLHKTFVWLA